MLKRDELTDPESCMSRARADERTFVLLGRDIAAPVAIQAWIQHRVATGKNKLEDPQIQEAFECASLMAQERPALIERLKATAPQPDPTQKRRELAERIVRAMLGMDVKIPTVDRPAIIGAIERVLEQEEQE